MSETMTVTEEMPVDTDAAEVAKGNEATAESGTPSGTEAELCEQGLTACGDTMCGCDEPARLRRPRVDIVSEGERTLLVADLPGVDETSLEIVLEKDVLTIRGTAAWPAPESFEASYREFPRRRYERSFRLTDEVDRSGITATMRNGVLRLELPKTAESKPTRIPVSAGA